MPKDKIHFPNSSCESSRMHPYANIPDNNVTTSPEAKIESEWEEYKCPICFEPPHNAISLICTSREKGCCLYMCNTSSLLSNCFAQFQNSCISTEGVSCPLCRGLIIKRVVKSDACSYMNSRPRNCSQENCDFVGTYEELKRHVEKDHNPWQAQYNETDHTEGSQVRIRNLTGHEYKQLFRLSSRAFF